MKIRNGFVSNSSSSSFHIYGTCIDESEIRKILIEKEIATEEGLDQYGAWEFFGEFESEVGNLSCYPDYDGGRAYIGRAYSNIGDDETGREFKKSATKAVKKLFGEEVECEEYEETVYN